MAAIYKGIIYLGDFFKHFFVLALRLYWGYSFMMAGWGKFWNIASVTEFFTNLGIPAAEYAAPLVAFVEFFGGMMLLFGFGARLAAIPLIITMVVALFTAHHAATAGMFDNPQRFINQLPFNYLMASLVVFCYGPGAFSIDGILKRKCCEKNQ